MAIFFVIFIVAFVVLGIMAAPPKWPTDAEILHEWKKHGKKGYSGYDDRLT